MSFTNLHSLNKSILGIVNIRFFSEKKKNHDRMLESKYLDWLYKESQRHCQNSF